MKHLFYLSILSLTIFGCQSSTDNQKSETSKKIEFEDFSNLQKAQVLVVGSYHFHQESQIDELSSENQQEIDKLVLALVAFKPTKVVLEIVPQYTTRYNEAYRKYINGQFSIDTLANECFQLGFKLAKAAGLDSILLFDNQTEFIGSLENFSFSAFDEYAQQNDSGFYDIYRDVIIETVNHNDSILKAQSLYDHIKQMNSESVVKANAQRMHLYEIRAGIQKNWIGPDWLSRYYQRNIRMMANVIRFTETNDRILIVVGNNHKWILDQLFEYNPEYRLIQPSTYL